VNAVARFHFCAASRDNVQLERFHAIVWRPRSASAATQIRYRPSSAVPET
jgi:hypothetical protein